MLSRIRPFDGQKLDRRRRRLRTAHQTKGFCRMCAAILNAMSSCGVSAGNVAYPTSYHQPLSACKRDPFEATQERYSGARSIRRQSRPRLLGGMIAVHYIYRRSSWLICCPAHLTERGSIMGRFRLRVWCRQTFLDFENYLVTADRIKEAAERLQEAQQDVDVSGPELYPGIARIGRTPSGTEILHAEMRGLDPADGDVEVERSGGFEIDNDDEPIRAIAGYEPIDDDLADLLGDLLAWARENGHLGSGPWIDAAAFGRMLGFGPEIEHQAKQHYQGGAAEPVEEDVATWEQLPEFIRRQDPCRVLRGLTNRFAGIPGELRQ